MVASQPVQADRCPLCASDLLDGGFERRRRDRVWQLVRCRSCGLRFTDPRPSKDDIRSFYSGDYHSSLRQPGAAERILGSKYSRYVSWIGEFLKSGKVLDIGCATGLFPKMLRDHGYDAEGVELNPGSAEWGQSHYGVPIRVGNLSEASPPGGGYDLISMLDLVEHAIHPISFLLEVREWLKPEGLGLVTLPNIDSAESRYYQMLWRATRRNHFWITCHIPLHIWEFTPATARRSFHEAGYQVVAFRRCSEGHRLNGKLALLSLPSMLVDLPLLESRLGTRMEFLIRRRSG